MLRLAFFTSAVAMAATALHTLESQVVELAQMSEKSHHVTAHNAAEL